MFRRGGAGRQVFLTLRFGLALGASSLAGCDSSSPGKERIPTVHRDTAGLGHVLRLDAAGQGGVLWAGLPLSDPEGLGPTDVLVGLWTPRPSGDLSETDSVTIEIPRSLADSLLPDSVFARGRVVEGRWSLRAPAGDPPGEVSAWFETTACGFLGDGVLTILQSH